MSRRVSSARARGVKVVCSMRGFADEHELRITCELDQSIVIGGVGDVMRDIRNDGRFAFNVLFRLAFNFPPPQA